MTRKDFVRIAAMINGHECPMGSNLDRLGGQNQSRIECAEKMADIFAADNARFDRAKFLKACGVES